MKENFYENKKYPGEKIKIIQILNLEITLETLIRRRLRRRSNSDDTLDADTVKVSKNLRCEPRWINPSNDKICNFKNI